MTKQCREKRVRRPRPKCSPNQVYDRNLPGCRARKKPVKKATSSPRAATSAADPLVRDLRATKDHLLRVNGKDVSTMLKQFNLSFTLAGEANEYVQSLLEETGHALLRNPTLWTTLPGTELKRHAVKAMSKSVHILESNTDAPDAALRVVDKNPRSAGLTLRANTAVRLTSLLEYICAEVMDLASKATMDSNKARVTTYLVRLALAHDDEFLAFFRHLGVETGASLCMEIPKGFRGYPHRHKDGSQAPPFRADRCFEHGQTEKRGVDGAMYVTYGTKWIRKAER